MKFTPLSSLLAFGLVLLSMVIAVPIADVSNDSGNAAVSIQDLHARQTAFDALQHAQSLANDLDGLGRERFTSGLIGMLIEQDPSFNYVVFLPRSEFHFQGQEGIDWDQTTVLYVQEGLTYGVVAGKAGTFKRGGDGGYKNWAYGGRVKSYDGKRNLEFGS